MRTIPVILLSAVLALSLPVGDAQAQGGPATFGVIGGLNFAKFGGKDVTELESDPGSGGTMKQERSVGLLLGVTMTKPINSALAFQPELVYSRKGSRMTFEETFSGFGDPAATTKGEARFSVSYLEVPLLAKITLPSQGAFSTHLVAGPAVAFRVACKVTFTIDGFTDPSEGTSDNCDSDDSGDGGMRKTDVGLVLGGGFTYHSLTLSARYELGLQTLDTGREAGDIKHRVLSFTVGMPFPKR